MNLSKTALRELSAKYRAVLMKCALMNMMIFAGALMPHTANAYKIEDNKMIVNEDSTLGAYVDVDTIAFDNTDGNHFTLSGSYPWSVTGPAAGLTITGDGTLKNVTILLNGNLKGATDAEGNKNTVSIDGSALIRGVSEGDKLISDINFVLKDDTTFYLDGNSAKDVKLTGSAASTVAQGNFEDADIDDFFGTAWLSSFKQSGDFSLGKKSAAESMKFHDTTYIYANQITGYYHGRNPDAANEFHSGDVLNLKNYENNAAGKWLLNDETVSLKGGKLNGDLSGGNLRIFDENSHFSGELTNIKIYIEKADYTWNDNIKINPLSTGTEFYLGDFNGSEQRVFNMDADITLSDETSSVAARYVTVNGNGKIITTRTLSVEENSWFNNVTIKFDDDLDVTGGGTLNMTNSTLHAEKNLATGNLNTTNSTLSAGYQITANDINATGVLNVEFHATSGDTYFIANNITGANGATVKFQAGRPEVRLRWQTNGSETLKISDVLLDFANMDTMFETQADFTNVQMKTSLKPGYSPIRFLDATFNGNNTITADSVSASELLVSVNSRLTLKNQDGTGNGLLNGNLRVDAGGAFTGNLSGDLNLYGHFTGDMQNGYMMRLWSDYDWSFNGKFNGYIEADIRNNALDMTRLKLTQDSTIEQLTLKRNNVAQQADVIVNSDLSVSNLFFDNGKESSSSANPENAGRITGTGTLKAENIRILKNGSETSENQTAYFNGINIAALNDDLTFSGDSSSYRYDFTNNAISAGNNIVFDLNTTFNGNSSLTAYHIKTEDDLVINGTLTLNGSLEANSITGGTLNVILPSAGAEGKLVSAKTVDNVKLTLNLKNVNNKEKTQRYYLTDNSSFTLSGSYGKYAFSDEYFTLEEWENDKNKNYYQLSEAWDRIKMGMDAINKPGYLWILKVAGGAEGAIDDLRMAGISVSPTEENASKILDMINDNPFADALTDLLDSGNAALQQQVLREIVPTDAAASSFKSAKNTANAVMNAVASRLGGASAVSGRSGGDLVVGQSSAWAQGMFNHAKMTGGFKSDTAGFSAGVETNLTDEIKAGVGYAYASTGIKTSRSKTDVDTNTGFVYGEYAPNALYVNAMLGFGRSDYDDKTKMSGMSNSYKADTYSARVAAGYDLGMLTPEAALRFTSVRQKAYTDDLGARVAAKNLNTATMVVGAKAAKTFTVGKYAVEPEAKAALTYDIARPNEDRAVTLPDGTSYIAAGEKLNRLGLEIGAQAAVRLTNEVELSVSYDGAFKERYRDHTGMLNLKVGF